MYLWDSNILRHFAEGHSALRTHLQRVVWSEIALPSIVIAETLRGRCEFALKATPAQAPFAHQQLIATQQMLQRFNVVVFDTASAAAMNRLQSRIQTRKRYADVMIAASALAGGHIVVTRNVNDFMDLLPARQLENWIDT